MPRTLVIAAALVALALPAQAENNTVADRAWTAFSTHCGKYVDAKNVGVALKTMDGLKVKMAVTADGWGITASATPDPEDIDAPPFIYHFSYERDDDGEWRHCALVLLEDGSPLPDMVSFARKNAASLLGDDFKTHGGKLLGEDTDLREIYAMETPGFPAGRAVRLIVQEHFVNLSLTIYRAAE